MLRCVAVSPPVDPSFGSSRRRRKAVHHLGGQFHVLQIEPVGRCRDAEVFPAPGRQRPSEALGITPALADVHQCSRNDAHHVVEKTVSSHHDVDTWLCWAEPLHADSVDTPYGRSALIPSTSEGAEVVLAHQALRAPLHELGVQWTENPVRATRFEWIGYGTHEDSVAISLPQRIEPRVERRWHERSSEDRDALGQMRAETESPAARRNRPLGLEAHDLMAGVEPAVGATGA